MCRKLALILCVVPLRMDSARAQQLLCNTLELKECLLPQLHPIVTRRMPAQASIRACWEVRLNRHSVDKIIKQARLSHVSGDLGSKSLLLTEFVSEFPRPALLPAF